MAKQVFYDPLQARWKRIRRFVDAAALAFSLLVVFFIYSALSSEPLPDLYSRLARTGRPQKQQIAHRTARSIQPSQKHLIDFRDLLDRLILAHNLPAQGSLKVPSVVATAVRIQHGCKIRSHLFGPLFSFRELHVFSETARFCHLGGRPQSLTRYLPMQAVRHPPQAP